MYGKKPGYKMSFIVLNVCGVAITTSNFRYHNFFSTGHWIHLEDRILIPPIVYKHLDKYFKLVIHCNTMYNKHLHLHLFICLVACYPSYYICTMPIFILQHCFHQYWTGSINYQSVLCNVLTQFIYSATLDENSGAVI